MMFTHIIPQLMTMAETSTMGSKHAAAIISGKRVLSMGTNYPLQAGELVDFATKSSASGYFDAQHRSDNTSHSFKDVFETKRQKCIKVKGAIETNRIGISMSC